MRMLSNFVAKGPQLCYRRISQFIRNHVSEETENKRQQPRPKHSYKELYQWKTLDEFAALLQQNLIYNEGGLIAINKPYGVPIYTTVKKPSNVRRGMWTSLPDAPHSLEDALNPLAKRLQVKSLQIVKTTEKYSSGVTLLASDDSTAAKVKKRLKMTKAVGIPFHVYWAVTVGYPNPPIAKEKVGVELQVVGNTDETQPNILWNFSINQMKSQKVRPVLVEYRTLAVDRKLSVSLMELAVTSAKRDFLRVYTAQKAACILGDPMYSRRIRHILGKAVVMGPQHTTSYNAQLIPEGICRALQLPSDSTTHDKVPIMLHLRSLIVKNYPTKGNSLVLTAPLSPHFEWTCQALGFMPMQSVQS